MGLMVPISVKSYGQISMFLQSIQIIPNSIEAIEIRDKFSINLVNSLPDYS